MDYIAQPKDYWIAPNAIHISLNALGDANRIQCSVASGAVIMCYIYGTANDGLGYDNGHQYRTWPIVIAPTYFNTNTQKYVYVAIPKNQTVGTTAMVVFPSEQLDIYGKNGSNEQIGSTDYFFIWLQGIISEVQEANSTLERQWTQYINYGLLDTDQARDAKMDDTAWYSYSHLTEVVTFLKEIVMNVGSSFRNIFLGPDGGKELTSVATDNTTPINSTTAVVTPAYASSKFLRKDVDDTATGKITFNSGLDTAGDIKTTDFQEDASGAGIYKDGYNNWHVEADYFHARKKLVAKEVQIEDVHHVGGQMLLTAASMTCAYVYDMGTYWRCYFNRVDEDGKEVTNNWRNGDQAYMQTFNLEQDENGNVGNRFYWRLVVGNSNAGLDTNVREFDGVEVDMSDYHFIDLSKSVCASLSDDPKAGDDIVQLGYQNTDDSGRQNAIVIAGADEHSPYIYQYVGINTFHLPEPETKIKPGDNYFSGLVKMNPGSIMPNGKTVEQFVADTDEKFENITTGNENLLLNTGFTGDYTSAEVSANEGITPDTEMYSKQLKYWTYDGVSVEADASSASGMSAKMEGGLLCQDVTKDLKEDEWYCITLKAKGGGFKVSLGGYTETKALSAQYHRYTFRFQCTDASDKTFTLSNGNCYVKEIMVTEGNTPNTDWLPSPNDNDASLAHFQNLAYLTNSMTEASTSILGGLILSQMLRVGNYRDGVMNGETGGMSGLCNSGQSPFLWGGGNMEKAFYTIAKYAQNPSYQATDEEVSQMAKFVVTHGGRAILNDIILRGYIYALGGVFKGEVLAESGIFKNITSPNGAFSIDAAGTMSCTSARVNGYLYATLFTVDNSNVLAYTAPIYDDSPDPQVVARIINLELTGLNVRIGYTIGSTFIRLPRDKAALAGARVLLFNNTQEEGKINCRGVITSLMTYDYIMEANTMSEFWCYEVSGRYDWVKIS